MDPRVATSGEDLAALLAFQREVEGQMARAADAAEAVSGGHKRPDVPRDEDPVAINGTLAALARDLESADAVPTAPQRELLETCRQALDRVPARRHASENGR